MKFRRFVVSILVIAEQRIASFHLNRSGTVIKNKIPLGLIENYSTLNILINRLTEAQSMNFMMNIDDEEHEVNTSELAEVSRRNLISRGLTLFLYPLILNGNCNQASASTLSRTKLGSPILTESVLLDLLPSISNEVQILRTIQQEIEKTTILRTIYARKQAADEPDKIQIPGAVWDLISLVSSKALKILETNRKKLEPVFREVDGAEVQIRRAERAESEYFESRNSLNMMRNASANEDIEGVLDCQEDALLHLASIGELLIPEFPFQVTTDEQYDSIPRLLGRAFVDLTIRQDFSNSKKTNISIGSSSNSTIIGNISIIADGFSAPVNAGNFIDLCLRGFFNDLPIAFDEVEDLSSQRNISFAVGGRYKDGFVDPVSGNIRRIPLEILRSDPKLGNVPFYGAARNTRIFTRSPPVQTFRIPGAVATYHPIRDRNGGSSEFFWLTNENLDEDRLFMIPSSERLDGKYSIFGYIIKDKAKIRKKMEDAAPGTIFSIDKATVTYGADNLVKTKAATFKEFLLKKTSSEENQNI